MTREKLEDLKSQLYRMIGDSVNRRGLWVSLRRNCSDPVTTDIENMNNVLAEWERQAEALLEKIKFALSECDHSHMTSDRAERLVSHGSLS